MTRLEHIGLFAVFFLGIVTISISIARFTTIYLLDDTNLICKSMLSAVLWWLLFSSLTILDVWSVAEINTSIIVVCLPSLRGLFTQGMTKSMSTVYNSGASKISPVHASLEIIGVVPPANNGSIHELPGNGRKRSIDERKWPGTT
jgi:hypothetical protein